MARKRRKNNLALPMGIITVILAVVGLITVIHFAVNAVNNQKNKAAEKAEYEKMLTPVVMFDPEPFDDLTQADKSQLLYASIWSLLMDEEGMSKYPYATGENFGIQIPQTDVEKSFEALFGNEIDISSLHSTIDVSRYDITYDAALQSYILPITGVESAYTPVVYSIDKQGSSKVLSVGYIGNKAWADISSSEYTAPEPDKYMKITLRERNGGLYIASIQAADGQEIASMVTTTTVPAFEEDTVPEDTTAPGDPGIVDESETLPGEELSETGEESTDASQSEAVTDETGNTEE